jgi:hypothetical protein
MKNLLLAKLSKPDEGENRIGTPESGGGLLAVVAVLGMLMVLVQGSMFYRAKTSAKFISSEKNHILAQQMAEAGIEDNIAEIGRRQLKVTASMIDYTTFDHKTLGTGSYTSTLTTIALGVSADTVDLTSTGMVGNASQKIQARLRLIKYLDTSRTALIKVTPDTVLTFSTHIVPETTTTTTIMDPSTMPALNATSAYAACMASGPPRCDVCHLPGGDVSKANVITIAKPAIGSHISHHGDYVTTDGTCDLYKPKTTISIHLKTILDTTLTITDLTTYDTTLVIDTVIKTQFLSWK